MVLINYYLLLLVHAMAYGFSSPTCDDLENKIASADKFTEILLPPPIIGHWVSERCEIREGPTYLLRSYHFYDNKTFVFTVHKYKDDFCNSVTTTITTWGQYSIRRGGSWATPGANQCDYVMDRVEIIPHQQETADEWSLRLNETCGGIVKRKWRSHNIYSAYNRQKDDTQSFAAELNIGANKTCLQKMHLGVPDVGLVRVQERPPSPPISLAGRVEILLGETRKTGTFFHTPLLKISPQISSLSCEVCLAVEKSSAKSPPSLDIMPRHSPVMNGEWISTRCETRPMGLFLRRRLKISGRTWHAEFKFFSDPKCLTPTLVASGQGLFKPVKTGTGNIPRIPGATDFDFMINQGFLTLHDGALVKSLQNDSRCNPPGGVWKVGIKRDVTPSHGCAPLGIVIPATEFELVKIESDDEENTLLFLGHSERDPSKKEEPKQRPTAFQPPLLQCNAPELPPLTHFLSNSHSQGHSLVLGLEVVFAVTVTLTIFL